MSLASDHSRCGVRKVCGKPLPMCQRHHPVETPLPYPDRRRNGENLEPPGPNESYVIIEPSIASRFEGTAACPCQPVRISADQHVSVRLRHKIAEGFGEDIARYAA